MKQVRCVLMNNHTIVDVFTLEVEIALNDVVSHFQNKYDRNASGGLLEAADLDEESTFDDVDIIEVFFDDHHAICVVL